MPEKHKPTPEELGLKESLTETEKPFDDDALNVEKNPETTNTKKPHGYWNEVTEEELIKEIESRGFDLKNLPPFTKMGSDLSSILQRRYGTVNKAREALGSSLIKKTDHFWISVPEEELIKEIESRGLDPKNLPMTSALVETDSDLIGGLIKRYGGVTKARQALGGGIMRVGSNYWQSISEEDLVKEIKSRGFDPKNLPSKGMLEDGNSDLSNGLRRRFGSLTAARKSLGQEYVKKPRGYWQSILEEDLVKEIESRGFDPKNLPESNEFIERNGDLVNGLRRRFGSLNKAREALGGELKRIPFGYWSEISEEELIKEIESRGLNPKNLPGSLFLRSNHTELASGLSKRFGGLRAARKALGGELIRKPKGYWENMSEEDFLKELESRGLDPKNLPSSSDLQAKNKDLTNGIVKRFGSFDAARKALGGELIRKPKGYWENMSEEELIDEIISRGLDPKNLPTADELIKDNLDLRGGLVQRFGSLNKAREALGGEILRDMSWRYLPKITSDLQETLSEITKGETQYAQEIQQLVGIFGNANCIDILYKFHPEYHKLPTGRVKRILADYLGEFLSSSIPLNLESIPTRGLELLENHTFQDSLIEIIKNDALSFFNKKKKIDSTVSPQLMMSEYLDNLRNIGIKHNNADLSAVIQTVELYYDSLYELRKPENIVNFVEQGRRFPEFYQQINIKEIADKNKILLADEMGVGKSASAILAKEYLGVRQALIVAPNNVIETWRGYLSDEIGEDGKQIGYFKEGDAPRVLFVDSLNSLDTRDLDGYDYILISQEKLNKKYTEKLNTLDYEMLIVDEVHKLKNIRSGIRATHLLDLASKIEGDDKYLALLSGTPIPNKVEDIAITLKLLYPEEFEHMPNKTLIQRIIHSDSIDLRTKLLPRMEMKKLAESVEMPVLEESIISPELSEIEQTIYEMLLEEDEIEPTEKIRILRQFLLNPELLDATPNIESSKISSVGESLRQTFEDKNKVVMFVNGYISQVIKGDKNIIDQLRLPADVEVKVIHGDVSIPERAAIQKELKESNQKILLLVSGQTADVGVDFSGGESVYFYNEPWTRYEQKQMLGRVYRPGLSEDLESKTFITKDTIEEGIHLYTKAKEQAIEKLLRGLPRSEIENRLLDESEKQTDPNLEVNPELARYYFSDWDKMAKIFAHIKEIGQENFMQFLADFGKDYASCYLNLGSRSYQANADRVSGTVIDSLVKESGQNPQELRILDIASGPEMLRKHIPTPYQSKVTSMDVNKEHFKGEGGDRVVGSFQTLPFADQSVDYANFALALHYTQFIPSRNNYERLEALMELNRVLKVGGKAVLNMIYSIDFKDENKLRNSLEAIGLTIKDEYSGEVQVGKNYKSKVFTLEKTKHPDESLDEMVDLIGKDDLDGLKFVGNKSTVRDTRKIIEQFELGGRQMKIDFNEDDRLVLAEEQEITHQGESLKAQYGSIQDISKEDIISNGFTRILIKDKYILFKRLEKGTGVVVVK